MKRIIIYNCVAILVVLSAIFCFYENSRSLPKVAHQKCPDDYADSELSQYNIDFDKWTNEFYDTHPDATLSDWSNARYKFWVINDCVAALKRYNEVKNGTADNAKMTAIRTMVSEMVISTSTK